MEILYTEIWKKGAVHPRRGSSDCQLRNSSFFSAEARGTFEVLYYIFQKIFLHTKKSDNPRATFSRVLTRVCINLAVIHVSAFISLIQGSNRQPLPLFPLRRCSRHSEQLSIRKTCGEHQRQPSELGVSSGRVGVATGRCGYHFPLCSGWCLVSPSHHQWQVRRGVPCKAMSCKDWAKTAVTAHIVRDRSFRTRTTLNEFWGIRGVIWNVLNKSR